MSPHGPASPVGNLAAAHVSATLGNLLIQEYSFGELLWRDELIVGGEPIDRVALRLNDRSGFDARLDVNLLERRGTRI